MWHRSNFLVWLTDVSDSTLLRGINLVIVQTVALVMNAWFPLVAYPADQAPHYSVGYYLATTFYCVEFLTTVAIAITLRVKSMRSDTVHFLFLRRMQRLLQSRCMFLVRIRELIFVPY
jgi:hypothetical protein